MTEVTTVNSADQSSGPAGPATGADAKKQTATKVPGAAKASSKPKGSGAQPKGTARGASKAAAAESMPAKPKATPSASRQTKAATVEAMLSSKEGATLEAMFSATGWQAHTCRAFLSGLRKKGREVVRYKDGQGGSIYRMTPLEAQKASA